MWMTTYVDVIKRQLIDKYGFPEDSQHPGCVLGNVPDGEYPMTINGRLDNVRIVNGKINCCNFADVSSVPPSCPPTLKSG